MRCPNCEKFVAYDVDVEPEEQDAPDMDGAESIHASYRRVLTCENCGEELKEATIEVDIDLPSQTPDERKCGEEDGHSWVVKDSEAEATMEMATKDRHGRPIKNRRYMRTLYGVKVTCTVECENCDAELTAEGSGSEAASSFEELA